MSRWLLSAALVGLLSTPTMARAEPGEFRVAGTYSRDASGLNGELVRVFVPWDGVNQRPEILDCLTGQYNVSNAVLTIPKPDRQVKLSLKSGDEGAWELLEASGACAGLSGSGTYRITPTPMVRLAGTFDLRSADEG